MTEHPADFVLIWMVLSAAWMVLSAAFGFVVGEAYGDVRRHQQCLQQTNDELRDRLQDASTDSKLIQRALKEQRGVINDIHRRLLAVSKGLEKRPS